MLCDGPTPEEARILEAHAAYVKDQTDKGVVVMAGRTQENDESSFGIVVFRTETDQKARDVMNHDPGVRHGVMQGDLYPFKIAFMGK